MRSAEPTLPRATDAPRSKYNRIHRLRSSNGNESSVHFPLPCHDYGRFCELSNAIKLFFPNPSLVQVLFEAIANALDADASEISIKIDINAFNAPETLQISITDNGRGFTDASFERFKRLLKPPDRFHKGLG